MEIPSAGFRPGDKGRHYLNPRQAVHLVIIPGERVMCPDYNMFQLLGYK